MFLINNFSINRVVTARRWRLIWQQLLLALFERHSRTKIATFRLYR